MSARRVVLATVVASGLVCAIQAAAEDEPGAAAPASAASASASTPASGSASGAPSGNIVPPADPERKKSLEPKPLAHSPDVIRFVADPLSDSAVLAISVAFLGVSQTIADSGELRPQQPVPKSELASIDKWAVDQKVDPNAAALSNIGIYAAGLYAVLDPVLTGVREKNAQAFLVDAIIYAQSAAVTGALTNLAKIAVRRPRPRAYAEQQRLIEVYGEANAPDISETDSALSFFSGHAAITATITATASYLAFARSAKGSIRPWLTLIIGSLVTTFTAYERVRAGAHFPTDVITGALVGAGVGVLVPHFHREQRLEQRPVWIGFEVPRGGGGYLSLSVGL